MSASTADVVSGVTPDSARRAEDEASFAESVGPLTPQLRAHCYRMLASTHDADDAVQETLLRAWRGLDGFSGTGSLRSWLYTIATRACLDALVSRTRRALPMDLGPASETVVLQDGPVTDVAWLQPFPTAGMAAGPLDPGATLEQQEAVELAFVAALQHLPPNQRAALVLFEVLGFSVAEIADTMQTSRASVNSALQRARKIVADEVPAVSQLQTLRMLGDERLREVVDEFTSALQDGDAARLVALLSQDVSWSMPPLPGWYAGIASVTDFAARVPLGACGQWRSRPVSANGQLAVALYLRAAGDGPFPAWSINLLSVDDSGRIRDITSFLGAEHFAAFGLPVEVPRDS
ncbi:MAG: sigma-70 family RNA polymerase sigma factor [Nakamurella sp.]